MILRELHSTGTRDIPTANYDTGYNKNHGANKRLRHRITEKKCHHNSTGEQTEKGFLGQCISSGPEGFKAVFLILLMRDIQEYAVRASFLKGVIRMWRN